jgi:hypothetical protein
MLSGMSNHQAGFVKPKELQLGILTVSSMLYRVELDIVDGDVIWYGLPLYSAI